MRLYRAEKIASHILFGTYFTQTLTNTETRAFLDRILTNPAVRARFGTLNPTLTLPTKGPSTAWADLTNNEIVLPADARNPIMIIHEVAHLLYADSTAHDARYAAIYRWLLGEILGADAQRILTGAFASMNIAWDDSAIPPIRRNATITTNPTSPLPGLTGAMVADAAEVLRTIAHAGLLGPPGDPRRANAWKIARLLTAHQDAYPPDHDPLPDTVEIPVKALTKTMTPEDVAALVMDAVRAAAAPDTRYGQAAARRVTDRANVRTPTTKQPGLPTYLRAAARRA
jgi:putative metallohydrolase (TIGR04338 family)